jgi:NTE family protein
MGGRTTILGRRPMYVDYSLQGTRRTTLRGSFGAVTPVNNAIEARVIEAYLHGAFGVAVSRKSILEISANAGYNFYGYESSYDEDDDPSTHDRFRYVAGRVAFERSTLDKLSYATRGSKLSLSAIAVHGRDRYENEELFAQNMYAHKIRAWIGGKLQWQHYPGDWQRTWFSVGYDIEAVYTTHPNFGNRYSSILSAPRYAPTPNSNMIFMPEFYTHRYAALGIMPTFRLMQSLYLRAGVFGMLRDPLYRVDDYMHYMADLSLVYHTRVGPVSLSVSKYNFKSRNNMYVTFNFGYPIFGRKGLFY